jgi:hypothetical protein
MSQLSSIDSGLFPIGIFASCQPPNPPKQEFAPQRKMGKSGSLRYNLCDNFLAEVHRPLGVERAPSPFGERRDSSTTVM